MSASTHLHAGFTDDDDIAVVARLGITLDNPIHEVWAALTQPDRLAQWLAPGGIQLVEGGRAWLDFVDSGIVIDSRVTAVEPQRLLEYSWSGPGEPLRPVRWGLEPVGPLTRLSLTLTLPRTDDVARSAAGWAAHLEMLTALLAGAATRFPFPVFQAARADYGAQLAELALASPEAVH
jgi:uncharacterized protein YndB with AHSA1/START domain